MPVPALVSALAPAAIQTIGGLAARAIGGRQRVPDLVAPAINASQAQLQDLETQQIRQLALIEDQAARTGSQGTAAREDLLNANARTDAAIRGNILDTVARARQQQELIETDLANQERAATIQGITAGASALGEGVGAFLNPVDAGISSTPASFNTSTPELTPLQTLSVVPETIAPVQIGIGAPTRITETPEIDFRPGSSVGIRPVSSFPSLRDQFATNVFRFNQ